MKIREVNSILRDRINSLISKGWFKSHIGKVLLGSNGQAHLNHFISLKEDNTYNDFGIKPLEKIAHVIDYEIRLVFVPKNNHSITDSINDANMEFFDALNESLVNYLVNHVSSPSIIKTSKTQIDDVLDEILEEVISENPISESDSFEN